MSGHCDFCGVWHSGGCCHPGRQALDVAVATARTEGIGIGRLGGDELVAEMRHRYETHVASLTADLAQAQQERDDAEQQLSVLRPGGLYAWKSKYEAVVEQLTAAEQARDEAQLRPDPLGVIDLVDDQRLQIQVRDEALLAIRRACGPDGHRVDLAGIAPLIVELLQSAARTALLEAAEDEESLIDLVESLQRIVHWDSAGAEERFCEAAYTHIAAWLTTRAGGGKA